MLLAVDTSTRWVGLALYREEEVVCEEIWTSQNHHTVELAPTIARLLQRTGLTPRDLTALAVATGPGSFTSLRIGMGLVKGMALALRLPVLGIPTLDIVAAAQPVQDMPLAAVIQAGRGRLGVGWYHNLLGTWNMEDKVQVMTVEDLSQAIQRPTLVCGELTPDERRLLARKRKNVLLASPAQNLRRPSFLAELAWKRWQAGQTDDPVTLAPVYLRTAEAIPE